MPRYTYSPQGTQILRATIPAAGAAVDVEQPLGQAPFDGYVSAARIELAAASATSSAGRASPRSPRSRA
jgi:hypothetical protein